MWTDERLTERFDGLDKRLDRIDSDIRDLRALMVQLWGSTIIGSLGIIATLVATR
jgi:tetrahydromethanopterin S-methyltransferase subunit G